MAVATVGLPIRRWGIAALLAAAALFFAGGAFGAVPSGNLLQNPGAESGPAIDPTRVDLLVPIPSWKTSGSFTVIKYGQGPANAPGTAPSGGGGQFFAGGFSGESVGAVATATQDVSVSAAAFETDLGVVRATLSGFLGGCARDSSRLDATFLDASAAALGTLTVGPVSATENPVSLLVALVSRSASSAVPPSTRSIRVAMTSTQVADNACQSTAWNNGYFDNLSLTLELNVTADVLKRISPADAAKLLLELPADKAAALLAQLAPADAAKILALLTPSQALAVLAANPGTGAQIVAQLSPSQALAVLASNPALGAKVVGALSPAKAFALLATDPAGGAKILAKLPFGVALKILKAAPAGSSAQVKALVKAMPPKLRAKFSKALHLK